MTDQRINEDWLFKVNSRGEIGKWITDLKYSYLWKRPSFRDDSDYIILTLNFVDRNDLLKTLGALGVELKKIPEDFAKPLLNKSYSFAEFEKFKNEIRDYPEFEQPGHCKVQETPVFIWVENKKIGFTFSGSCQQYIVCETDFENCLEIERIIEQNELTEKVNRDIESNIGCITKTKYPEL